MPNEYYDSTGAPSTGSSLSSSVVRAEFDAVEAAFSKLPVMAGNQSKPVFVNSAGSALETVAIAAALALLGGASLSDVTAALALKADASALALKADITALALKADATALALKADIASPSLLGVPAAPTAALNTATTQIATTEFVNNAFVFQGQTQGYIRFPGGIVFQWGTATCHATPGQPVAISFPLAFTTLFGIIPGGASSATTNSAVWHSDRTTTGFNARAAYASQGVTWFAIGFITPA